MEKIEICPIGIILNFFTYEESEEDDSCFEFDRDFYVSLCSCDMLSDLDAIEKMLDLSIIDRHELLHLIISFQHGEVKEYAELEATNGHSYIIRPKYVYSMETCEEASFSGAGAVGSEQRLTLH